MIEKTSEKELAIKLRREGKTYREILEVVPVAKSTLSLWLRSVDMAKRQKQMFTEKKRLAQMRGGEARKKHRIERANSIIQNAGSEIGIISARELFLLGVVLYWAEGSKEKEHRVGSSLSFINMDSNMVRLYLHWLLIVCKIPRDMIGFEAYIHESHTYRIDEIKHHWSQVTQFPIECFEKIRIKKNKLSETKRKNTGNKYFGCLKISVKKSNTLVRKVAGWVNGIMNGIDI